MRRLWLRLRRWKVKRAMYAAWPDEPKQLRIAERYLDLCYAIEQERAAPMDPDHDRLAEQISSWIYGAWMGAVVTILVLAWAGWLPGPRADEALGTVIVGYAVLLVVSWLLIRRLRASRSQ